MKTIGFACFICLLVYTADARSQAVTGVMSGTEIQLGTGHTVHYFGIATPGLSAADSILVFLAIQAQKTNRELVYLNLVSIERPVLGSVSDREYAAFVHVGDLLVNAELVRRGLAKVTAEITSTEHAELLYQLESEAREAHRGFWAHEAFQQWQPPVQTAPMESPTLAAPLVAPATATKGRIVLHKNPDGPPGSWAIEPFYDYGKPSLNDSLSIDATTWEVGLRLIFPLTTWGTLFLHGAYGGQDVLSVENAGVAPGQSLFESEARQYRVGGSLRIWFFRKEDG